MYIKDKVTNTIIIEKSKFITYLYPISLEDEYKTILKEIKKKHYDADHVCSGFILKNTKKSSDDGEPQGTAGIPILSTLEKNNLENIAAFVVRYFGGIKLGAGGLIRAYGSSVSEALHKASFVTLEEYNKYELVLNYELANKVNNLLNRQTINLNVEYDTEVKYTYLSNDDKLINSIAEITSGIKPVCIGKEVIQKDV